jgi:uncharacterized FAD-dependent dehydrogenase
MIKTDITVKVGYTEEDIKDSVIKSLPLSRDELREIRILKRALDLKDKGDIHYKMTVALSLSEDREAGLLKMRKKVFSFEEYSFIAPRCAFSTRPAVVGSGPSGLFAALVLAEGGARPVIFERGLPVEERRKRVDAFNTLSILDPECNVQFGEGGAGTYSDGKLKSGAADKYKMKVLSEFVLAGAEEEILYSDTAHLGTDKLSDIIKNLREKIISLGGEFIYSAKVTDIKIRNEKISAVIYEKDGERVEFLTDRVILATGHSARDVFSMLERHGIPMEQKGFGIGMRIEHPREYIDRLVYGDKAPSGIETASYRLVTHLKNGRSVYSFCMCPGGTVVAAASEMCGTVTNGMSEFSRHGENSNAAFLVSVTPSDFGDGSPLAGLLLQRRIEKRAYSLTDSYKAPAVTLGDFTSLREPRGFGSVKPSYPIGVENISPEEYLPSFVTDSLRASIADFDAWMDGFYLHDAVMTGPETRTTSPIRILRNGLYESPTVKGLYPSGEGAGYSGGIVSSAIDGIKCAEAMLLNK